MDTNEGAKMLETSNGYILCDRHAQAWQSGGNTVEMWEMTAEDQADARAEGWDGNCSDCADEMAVSA